MPDTALNQNAGNIIGVSSALAKATQARSGMENLTTAEIQPANIGEIQPEFGTSGDVRKYFGIKKGSLYNLHKLGKVRGKVLRVTGQFKGIRLWDMKSVRAYIQSQADEGIGLAV